jgi:hypothetical protein
MREVEDQYLNVRTRNFDFDKTASVENIVLEAQGLARKAIVAYSC